MDITPTWPDVIVMAAIDFAWSYLLLIILVLVIYWTIKVWRVALASLGDFIGRTQ